MPCFKPFLVADERDLRRFSVGTVVGRCNRFRLGAAAPLVTDLVRQIPGPDRPDYWTPRIYWPIP